MVSATLKGSDMTIVAERSINNGTQEIHRFDNGYGASKVMHDFSYGGNRNLWEIAVIKFTGDGEWDWHITYDTHITGDVIGHLTYTAAQAVLQQIKELT
jgi:hypothetical protein